MPAGPRRHTLVPARLAPRKHRAPERRGSARERGYTARWELFRLSFLRQHPLCAFCLADGDITPAEVVDHDLPHRGDRDLFWRNTFTALCHDHHRGEKARIEAKLDGEELLRWVKRRKAPRADAQL